MSHASVVKPRLAKPPIRKRVQRSVLNKPAPKGGAHLRILRHRLLTPLNHIIGYAEMLLEEAPKSGYSSAGQHLKRIRETARELARFIHANLVPRHGKSAEKLLAGVRFDLAARLHTILQAVGAITSDPLAPEGEDVMKIGRAATELLGLVHAGAGEAESAAPIQRTRRGAFKKAEPGRILIVDDNRANRELLARRLRRHGHHVTEAPSGAEALELLTGTAQDVVVLDLLMPKLNGFQVLEKIKADPALKEIPVIVVSALDEIPGVVRSLEIGAEDYLFKPIDPVLLAARVASSVEKKRLRDLEKRRAADLEQALERVRLSEERLRLALKAGRARMWEWDLERDRVDDGGERTLEEALERIHADDRERVRERLFHAVEQRTEFHEEMRVAARGGGVSWVESLARLDFNSAGRAARMIGITRDITRRKQIEEDLRRSKQDFQRFAVAASHDLQEPLRAVSSKLEPLAAKLEGEDARAAKSAADSLARMSKLVADLLDYSQMSPAPVRKRPVSAEAVLHLVLTDLKPMIEAGGATIAHDKLPVVAADFMMFHRVLMNLISNAIQYRGKEAARVHVRAAHSGCEWMFRVADNGVGIDARQRGSIFGVFRRLHGRDIAGSGLGLAISKRMVERMGGRMWVEPGDPKGSIFCFTLPDK